MINQINFYICILNLYKMYVQGKIIDILEEQSGETSNGKWRKKEFVIETFAKIPRKVCLSLRGEAIDSFRYQIGDAIQVSIDIESRSYNGKYFTEVRAWKIEPKNSENANSNSEEAFDSPF